MFCCKSFSPHGQEERNGRKGHMSNPLPPQDLGAVMKQYISMNMPNNTITRHTFFFFYLASCYKFNCNAKVCGYSNNPDTKSSCGEATVHTFTFPFTTLSYCCQVWSLPNFHCPCLDSRATRVAGLPIRVLYSSCTPADSAFLPGLWAAKIWAFLVWSQQLFL